MATSQILTLGFGNFGNVNYLPTLGFLGGDVVSSARLIRRMVDSDVSVRSLAGSLAKRVFNQSLTERDIDSNLIKRSVDSNLTEREP